MDRSKAVSVVAVALMALASFSRAAPGDAAPEGAATHTATAPQAGAVSSPTVERTPPVGTIWRYSFRDQQFGGRERAFSIEVVRVNGKHVEERLQVEGGDISQTLVDASQLRFQVRPLANGYVLLELTPYSTDPAGSPGQVLAGYPTNRMTMWSIAAPTYREERVTVPAGTFTTTRIEVIGRSTPGAMNNSAAMNPTRFNYACWYSAEHGRCVKIRHQTWNQVTQQIGDEIVQLTAYELGRGAMAAATSSPAAIANSPAAPTRPDSAADADVDSTALESEPQDPAAPASAPPGTPATVLIYRVGDFSAWGFRDAYFYVNDVNIVDLSHRMYTQFQIPPGEYSLTQKWPYDITFGGKMIKLRVRWLPGRTYYYKLEAHRRDFYVYNRTNWRFGLVAEALGRADTSKLAFRDVERLDEVLMHR